MKTPHLGLSVSCLALSVFLTACSLIGAPGSKDQPGATGALNVDIPAVSFRMAAALSSAFGGGDKALGSRAFLFASRAELELHDAQGVLVDTWTSSAAMELLPGTTADTSRTVPAGSGYRLNARIFNDKVSTNLPVVEGEVMGITVNSGVVTTVTMPCIPNATLFHDTLVAGTPATGTLDCATMASSTPPYALNAVGGEAWFRIEPSVGMNRIELAFSSAGGTVAGYISLFRSDGAWMGRDTTFHPGQTVSLGAAVTGAGPYYVGIGLAWFGTPTSAQYSLTLTESATTTGNLVVNGDFSDGTNGWGLYTSGLGSATMTVVNGETKIHIATGGDPNSANLVFYQRGIPLIGGKNYRLGFKGRVSTGDLSVFMQWGDYGGALGLGDPAGSMTSYGGISVTETEVGRYSDSSFFVAGPSTANAYLILQLTEAGISDVDLYLDDITLTEVETIFPAPGTFTATQSGRSVVLNWDHVAGAAEYVLTRLDANSGPIAGTIYTGTATSYTDTANLWYGRPIHYRVSAKSSAGFGTPATRDITLAAKPVNGTIKDSGMSAGIYTLIITDPASQNLTMTGTVTLDAQGAGSFSLLGGERIPAGKQVWFIAFFDLITGSNKSNLLNTGDRVSRPLSFTYDAGADDGTITDMRLWEWSTAGSLPILAGAGRLAPVDTASLTWWDIQTRDPASVLIQRSSAAAGPYATISPSNPYALVGSTSGVFSVRGCNDLTATTGTRWYYRIGVDANGNNILDPGEYSAVTNTDDAGGVTIPASLETMSNIRIGNYRWNTLTIEGTSLSYVWAYIDIQTAGTYRFEKEVDGIYETTATLYQADRTTQAQAFTASVQDIALSTGRYYLKVQWPVNQNWGHCSLRVTAR